VHVPAPASPDLPAIVFLHGASGNLLDQMLPVRAQLEGRAELLFLDRPGHGWSTRGSGNEDPYGQSDTIAALMQHYRMDDAIVVGHSFGGGIAASFALRHPQRVRGLVFLAAATHPWPGGAWYYRLASMPIIGRLFTETLALPGGRLSIGTASGSVFDPNAVPSGYTQNAAIPLVLRPAAFRANATDVAGLHAHVSEVAALYPSIAAPTIVISGDADTVVYEEIHSLGLVRDIPGAELVWIKGLGHKPDWVAPELTVAALERIAGGDGDIQSMARAVEERLAGRIAPLQVGQAGAAKQEAAEGER
jgi:pimeloyl-ACP methyl ester carboxylesterase